MCRAHRHARKSGRMREHKAGIVKGEPTPRLCVRDWGCKCQQEALWDLGRGRGDSSPTAHTVCRAVRREAVARCTQTGSSWAGSPWASPRCEPSGIPGEEGMNWVFRDKAQRYEEQVRKREASAVAGMEGTGENGWKRSWRSRVT